MAILKIRDSSGVVQEVPFIQGEKGQDGYTPLRGTDYWTEGDKNEIKQYIDEQLGVIENGSY
jgi:hypothetical protein